MTSRPSGEESRNYGHLASGLECTGPAGGETRDVFFWRLAGPAGAGVPRNPPPPEILPPWGGEDVLGYPPPGGKFPRKSSTPGGRNS